MSFLKKKHNFFKILFLFFFFYNSVWGFKVIDVKNDKILIDLENKELQVGDIVEALPEAPVPSSAVVLQVRPGQAVARLNEGSDFTAEQALQLRSPPKKEVLPKTKKEIPDEEIGIVFRNDLKKIAFVVKSTADNISTKQSDNTLPFPNTETVAMSGSNVGFALTADYPVFTWLRARGLLGYEPIKVQGQAQFNSCNNKSSKNCYVNINYLTTGLLLRYDFTKKRANFWGAFGGTLKFPVTKESTALKQSDISVANSLLASAGLDFAINNKYYLPLSFEYHYSMNTSDTVPVIDQLAVQAGVGYQF